MDNSARRRRLVSAKAKVNPEASHRQQSAAMFALIFVMIHCSIGGLAPGALGQQLVATSTSTATTAAAATTTTTNTTTTDSSSGSQLIAASATSSNLTSLATGPPEAADGALLVAAATAVASSEQPTLASGDTAGAARPPPYLYADEEDDINNNSNPHADRSEAARARDEGPDGSDLNFSLMNAPHDRIQAVKHLLSTQRSDPVEPMVGSSSGAMGAATATAQGNPMQCTHKGRQYLNGQPVPIDEQPCLNCTCRRAILQCYLRVCPPIVSLEAHKKIQAMATQENGGVPQKCRMVKEPNKCCPSMRCESDVSSAEQQPTMGNPMNNFTNTIAISLDNLPAGQMLSVTPANPFAAAASSPPAIASNRSIGGGGGAEMAHAQQPMTTDDLPSIGKRPDSILIITSNPVGAGLAGSHTRDKTYAHSSSPDGGNSTTTISLTANLLDAILETVYASAAQLNGLNLQGSCMINGSLYVEGSAVLPESNAYCQYCYCIRQKVMCVKPKCHLSISGCTPKYSNDYACCPTSYSCTNQDIGSTMLGGSTGGSGGSGPARLSAGSQSLSSKLSAAIESISRLSHTTSANTGADGNELARQVDRSLKPEQVTQVPTAMLALMNSMGELSAANETLGTTSAATAPTTTTSTTTTTTTSTTTTTTRAPSSETTSSRRKIEESSEARDDEDEGDEDSGGPEEKERDKRRTEQQPRTGGGSSTTPSGLQMTTNTTTEQPSSVSDFLEPMNKLGPLVMSPTNPSGCTENGRQYGIGEQIPTLESCKHCYCGLEGIKECKMIECSLKVAHNCKPITPDGHCCPVRYECPSSSAGSSSSSQSYSSQTASSVDSSSPFPFRDIQQCNDSSLGLDDECHNSAGPVLRQQQQQQQGLTPPVLKTVRLVNEAADNEQQSMGHNTRNESAQLQQQQSLNEELNKFIMQINQHQNSTRYSLVPTGAGSNETTQTQEMMINDQHSRMVDMDYHSVQAPAASNAPAADGGQRADSPSPIPAGMVGIPSIEPAEHIDGDLMKGIDRYSILANEPATSSPPMPPPPPPIDPTTGRFLASSVEYSSGSGVSGQRDSRSTNAHRLVQTNFSGLAATAGYSGGPSEPHVRLLRDHHSAPPAAEMHAGPPSMGVVFDDELNSTSRHHHHHLSSSGRNGGVVEPSGSSDSNRFDQQPPNGAGGGMAEALNFTTTTTTLLPSGEEDPSLSSTPTPPQPTTGTPLGLDVDRHQETNGWLKSLSGIVQSFGRRLSSSSTNFNYDGLQDAASSDNSTDDQAATGAGGVAARQQHHQVAPTGRSDRQPSLFNQLLKSVIGTTPEVGRSSEQPPTTASLVMRPLASLIQTTAPLSMPTSSSEVEIVTAPVPNDPEVFAQSDVISSSSFARRSDVGDGGDEIVGVPESHHQSASNYIRQQQPSPLVPQQRVQQQTTRTLSCYDSATNRTYQQNEIIPKDDPCKTCSCILGSELCQTLVCPERPADNCSEERRPGECCANYLCTGNTNVVNTSRPPLAAVVGQSLSQPPPSQPQIGARMIMDNSIQEGGNRMPGQLIAATHSAMHVDTDVRGPTGNGLSQFQFPAGSYQQQRPPQVFAQQSPHFTNHNNNNNNNQRAGNNGLLQPRQPSLPQHPIRTSDFVNSLPAHLRFRPNSNSLFSGGQVVPSTQSNGIQRPPLTQQQFSHLGNGNPMMQHPGNTMLMHPQRPNMLVGSRIGGQVGNAWQPSSSAVAQSGKERILFQTNAPVASMFGLGSQTNDASGGFKPIAPPSNQSPPSSSTTAPPPLVTSTATITLGTSSVTPEIREPEPDKSPDVSPTTTNSSADIIPASEAFSSPSPSSSTTTTTTTTTTTPMPTTTTPEAVSTSTEHLTEISSTQTNAMETTSPAPAATEALTITDSDPLSMFRVSECNIYGRLYLVGQTIEELSDVCKRCTCTSMGVDCQSKCR